MENKVYLLETTLKNEGWVTTYHKNQVFSTMKAAQDQLRKSYGGHLQKYDDIEYANYNLDDRAEVKFKLDNEYVTVTLTITPLIVNDAN